MKLISKLIWLLGTLALTIFIILTNQDNPIMANLWIPIYYMIIVMSFFLGDYAGKKEILDKWERSEEWNSNLTISY